MYSKHTHTHAQNPDQKKIKKSHENEQKLIKKCEKEMDDHNHKKNTHRTERKAIFIV